MNRRLKLRMRLRSSATAELGVDVAAALAAVATVPISFTAGRATTSSGLSIGRPAWQAALPRRATTRGRHVRPTNSAQTRTRRCRSFRGAIASTCTRSMENLARRPWIVTKYPPSTFVGGSIGPAIEAWSRLQPHYFSHPMPRQSHPVTSGRRYPSFWIDHGVACRHIGAAFGRAIGTPPSSTIGYPMA